MNRHVMLDLETMGTRAGCAVLSIGMAEFRVTGEIVRSFHRIIDLRTCLDVGLDVDPKTEDWWGKQSGEVRTTLDAARNGGGMPVANVLYEASSWLSLGLTPFVWGNGADFDLPILSAAYQRCGFGGPPWKPFHGRCYRTLKELLPTVPKPERKGTHHNALDDAVWQATHAAALLREWDRLKIEGTRGQVGPALDLAAGWPQGPTGRTSLDMVGPLGATGITGASFEDRRLFPGLNPVPADSASAKTDPNEVGRLVPRY